MATNYVKLGHKLGKWITLNKNFWAHRKICYYTGNETSNEIDYNLSYVSTTNAIVF